MSADPVPNPREVTQDALLGGRVRFTQPARGYRVAIDPVLLAAAVPAQAGDRVLDLGCGVGAVLLCLGARVPGLTLLGVEIDPLLAMLARDNLSRNAGAGEIVTGDLTDPALDLGWGAVDHAVLNPPFHPPDSAPSPDPRRRRATLEMDLDPWLTVAARNLKPRGRLSLIHRADRLPALLGALAPRFGSVEIIPFWPQAGRAAKRVVLRAIKGGRGPAVLHPGLVLHAGAELSAAARAVVCDAAPLLPDGPPPPPT